MELEACEQARQLARLLLRRARQNRIAVEVYEEHPAAAAHHAPRGDGGVDPTREEAGHAAARADRQPAGAADLAERVERLGGQRLDVDRELRLREVDAPV